MNGYAPAFVMRNFVDPSPKFSNAAEPLTVAVFSWTTLPNPSNVYRRLRPAECSAVNFLYFPNRAVSTSNSLLILDFLKSPPGPRKSVSKCQSEKGSGSGNHGPPICFPIYAATLTSINRKPEGSAQSRNLLETYR